MKNVTVILSGGMDSSVLLLHHVKGGDRVRAVTIDYGQRHRREISSAATIAYLYHVPHEVVNLSALGAHLKGSSQTDSSVDVPKGHYAQENMKLTVVPNRNMILLSVATAVAIANGSDFVSYGAHAGDHAIYPDCRPEFADTLNEAIKICDWRPMELLRPFIKMTKAQIVTLGSEMGMDFKLTWSCYEGKAHHCGSCGTCIERREAFHLAGVKDPTQYGPQAPSVEDLVANSWRLPAVS